MLVTTTWVLTELADALCAPSDRMLFHAVLHNIRSDSRMKLVPADQELFERGLDLYLHRPDKSWSLTDCIFFIAMQRHSIADALNGDHHFEQTGFRALLK